ncbi:hypothetical protein - conserved [Leishmania donovani]|uniref:Uncharacterized protein n=3 Tax=Leishmania donovani species complex TaxID=38574 RepID=A4HRY0_LEIIN|nr:conserved hypothetical protein [Leishmania infantum JPCM5]TPP52924.1 hypothetical protein CGC20_27250 [Leishmania donovani]CAC9440003.1 hypothetical_protein_-_conserved [Leishmania infantum]CAJ1985837.1 hypothetical protein - conserved [Leishmania donovani]CAM60043.1 conserved hypothetical protein [Leishmania infantum JPCM5]SUZ38790.1 hypothetical_protein_-_conserved [Leishmania infantum]|eukprot:XP_001462822.1 conserved hypothetical protein [Leishmania infantum JPCM5]
MFKGLLCPVLERRAARRLATVANSACRGGRQRSRETVLESTRLLEKLQKRQGPGRTRTAQQRAWRSGLTNPLSSAESSAAAQADALAQEEANWRAADPLRKWKDESEELRRRQQGAGDGAHSVPGSAQPTSSSHYDAVNADTGNSAVQERFDALVHRALLRYGPPLPVEVVMNNNVISAASFASGTRRAAQHSYSDANVASDKGADDSSAVYYDEVALKLHELMTILRKEEPHFSLRDDCDGVPLSLMVKNCCYLRAFGGKVNYMRFVRRLRADELQSGGNNQGGGVQGGHEANAAVVSLGKYMMRELPSQDGLRKGPQPWRYTYRMI